MIIRHLLLFPLAALALQGCETPDRASRMDAFSGYEAAAAHDPANEARDASYAARGRAHRPSARGAGPAGAGGRRSGEGIAPGQRRPEVRHHEPAAPVPQCLCLPADGTERRHEQVSAGGTRLSADAEVRSRKHARAASARRRLHGATEIRARKGLLRRRRARQRRRSGRALRPRDGLLLRARSADRRSGAERARRDFTGRRGPAGIRPGPLHRNGGRQRSRGGRCPARPVQRNAGRRQQPRFREEAASELAGLLRIRCEQPVDLRFADECRGRSGRARRAGRCGGSRRIRRTGRCRRSRRGGRDRRNARLHRHGRCRSRPDRHPGRRPAFARRQSPRRPAASVRRHARKRARRQLRRDPHQRRAQFRPGGKHTDHHQLHQHSRHPLFAEHRERAGQLRRNPRQALSGGAQRGNLRILLRHGKFWRPRYRAATAIPFPWRRKSA